MSADFSATLPFAPMQPNIAALQGQPMEVNSKALGEAVPKFEAALERANAVQEGGIEIAQVDTRTTTIPGAPLFDGPQTIQPVQQTGQVNQVNEIRQSADVDAQARAAEGLGLETPQPATEENGGTAILNGLEQLRSVFDGQYANMGSQVQGSNINTEGMFALQAEVIKYSVLVDVSSKLAGKSTQAMDSLMKGQ